MKKNFNDLVELSKHLRSPEGCPWDREQKLETLRPYIIEEAYEVVQAIELKDKDEIIEELGDLFFQVIFASQIASEDGEFDIEEVIDRLHNKLVRRHPHVFGDEKAKDAEEAIKTWHRQKLKEKSRKRRLLEIPRTMPSLLRAHRVGEKASQVGFDWKNAQQVLPKVKEELNELEVEINNKNRNGIEKEFGDLVFSIVNLGRHLKLDSESTAHKAIDSFINRFSKVEDKAQDMGKQLSELSLEEMDELWEEVKRGR
ncbi:MAG: nucleoside triphosphate pyrophosphohydrolase [Candidatus Dadabacteria bacterium]|nr:nucleoside triphosphate pyrophosphohydrolase [Candidatus Dadabacteria bacterium]TDI88790.1 MAG: nucleoside triphosphate pyrophosphohydrolase [Candidatus Dadabacteria bacterium]TDJ02969.1 MAG: nucleoside triphosphate pyrophosphohydrolase [Candidatus Dadabacteria bacterium]